MAAIINVRDRAQALRGHFSMRVLDRAGKIIDRYEDPNMIVNLARIAMSILVSEGGDSGKIITTFGVGTNQETATPSDTSLTDIYTNQIWGHDFPEPGTVRFFWRLGYDEANEKNACEFGLFCADGSLFSRKVRSPIYKASDIAFEGEWSIIF